MKEISPFTTNLYDHSYDIDTLLIAFCALESAYLHTRSGVIKTEGTSGSHCFRIEPLPESFVSEVQAHPKRNALTEADNDTLSAFLDNAHIADFPDFFNNEANGFASGWLRERVKDVILEWLDFNNLIPPSMRHVRDSSAFSTLSDNPKVKIELT